MNTPSHAAYLTTQVAAYQRYLDHADPAVRLVGLQAIYDALDSRFAMENAPKVNGAQPETSARQVNTLTRLVTRIRRVL